MLAPASAVTSTVSAAGSDSWIVKASTSTVSITVPPLFWAQSP